MATFSGFLSNLNLSSSLSNNNDIMSSVSAYNLTLFTLSNGNTSTYDAGYMYIGDLLIQFTSNPSTANLPLTSNSGNAITVNFPKGYTSVPYCVLATVYEYNSGANLSVTVSNINPATFDVATGNGTGYIQYIAIGPKPTS